MLLVVAVTSVAVVVSGAVVVSMAGVVSVAVVVSMAGVVSVAVVVAVVVPVVVAGLVVELQSPVFLPVVHSSHGCSCSQAEKVQHSSQWLREVVPHSVKAVQESCASQMVEH